MLQSVRYFKIPNHSTCWQENTFQNPRKPSKLLLNIRIILLYKKIQLLGLLENNELRWMDNLIEQSQNKNTWLIISASILDKEV